MTAPRCTCSIWQNTPSRSCPKHGDEIRSESVEIIEEMLKAKRYRLADYLAYARRFHSETPR